MSSLTLLWWTLIVSIFQFNGFSEDLEYFLYYFLSISEEKANQEAAKQTSFKIKVKWRSTEEWAGYTLGEIHRLFYKVRDLSWIFKIVNNYWSQNYYLNEFIINYKLEDCDNIGDKLYKDKLPSNFWH